jgi:DNA-binding transcriptional ArsR family regulator
MLTNKQITKIRKSLNGTSQRAVFKILADTNRYRIFQILDQYPELRVGNIAKILKISIPLTSQHLKILEQGNMLQKERKGQKVYYKLKGDNRIVHAIIREIIALK